LLESGNDPKTCASADVASVRPASDGADDYWREVVTPQELDHHQPPLHREAQSEVPNVPALRPTTNLAQPLREIVSLCDICATLMRRDGVASADSSVRHFGWTFKGPRALWALRPGGDREPRSFGYEQYSSGP
jgi:hypothetical protein